MVWRDPRDVYVSLYHHAFFVHQDYPFNKVAVKRAKSRYKFDDYDDVKANLPFFVKDQFVNPLTPNFSWADFAKKWHGDANAVHVRYEDLRQHPAESLRDVIQSLGFTIDEQRLKSVVEKHDISKKEHTGKSFVRRGKVAGYLDYLDHQTIDIVNQHCQPWMKKLGYEE
ncbi:MAG: sulfotransferase domain-containing protein [Rubripirellula sp.]